MQVLAQVQVVGALVLVLAQGQVVGALVLVLVLAQGLALVGVRALVGVPALAVGLSAAAAVVVGWLVVGALVLVPGVHRPRQRCRVSSSTLLLR